MLGEPGEAVEAHPIGAEHLEVEVRTGRLAGGPDDADLLAGGDALTLRHLERSVLHVPVRRRDELAAEETSLAAGLETERRLYELAMATEDRVEGMRAFLEKREPRFEGR